VTLACITLLTLLLSGFSVVDPVYPPNAAGGGTVVAVVKVAGGQVKDVTVLWGEEPFVASCKDALARWSFSAEADINHIVVVYFRKPELLSAASWRQKISAAKAVTLLPYPRYVFAPSYPPNALAQGSVVIRVEISEEGRVVDQQVIKPMGILTEASKEAVAKWEFYPARDHKGRKIASHAYVVLVFRFPVIVE